METRKAHFHFRSFFFCPAATEGSSSYGGQGSLVPISALYGSSITAGDVRIVGGDTGNSFTNSSGATKRAATGGAQKRATWSDLLPVEVRSFIDSPALALAVPLELYLNFVPPPNLQHDFERWHQERAPSDLSLDFLNVFASGPVLAEAYSTITVNGKLEILPGTQIARTHAHHIH